MRYREITNEADYKALAVQHAKKRKKVQDAEKKKFAAMRKYQDALSAANDARKAALTGT